MGSALADMIRKDLTRILRGHGCFEPVWQRLMPAEIMPAQLLVMLCGKGKDCVRRREVVFAGRGTKRFPLHRVFRNKKIHLPCNNVSIWRLTNQPLRNHGTADQ